MTSPVSDAIPCDLLSWTRVHALCRRLAGRIVDAGFRPDAIVAVARGGYPPARLLCDYLGVMLLTGVRVVHYHGMSKDPAGARVVDPLGVDLSGRRVLVVDDVSDTGDTFRAVLDHVAERGPPRAICTAVLLHKHTSRVQPDFHGVRQRRWRWVSFPWARIEDLSSLVARLPTPLHEREAITSALLEHHGIRISDQTLDDVLRFGEGWSSAGE